MTDHTAGARRLDDSGTVLESAEAIRASLRDPDSGTAVERQPGSLNADQKKQQGGLNLASAAFRPVIRPPTPRLIVLDDGEASAGETVRLRDAVTVIGRTEGRILLPHDSLVSGKHAEVVREGNAAPFRWALRDLGSSNGTFVCCTKAIFNPSRLLILGSHRFRFMPAKAVDDMTPSDGGTALYDARQLLDHAWPRLVETAGGESPVEFVLRSDSLTLGRPNCGNDVEIDDPLIAARHARIVRDASGQWKIEALPSKNGIWVQVSSIQLTNICRFQCGEQRFLFLA